MALMRSGFAGREILAYGAAVLLLSAVALYNGFPLFYPDSVAYLSYGDQLMRWVVPDTDRPVFYGLVAWPFQLGLSIWPIVFAQALLVAYVVRVTLRCAGVSTRPLPFVGVVAALAVLTPVSFYVSMIMPDIFAGIAVLGVFLLGGGFLSPRERLGFGLIVFISLIVHPSHLATALALAGLAAAWRLLGGPARRLYPLRILGLSGLTLALSLAFSVLVFGQFRLDPNGPPFLMGRLIADGRA